MALDHCVPTVVIWLLFYTPCATICLFSTFPIIYPLIKVQTETHKTPKLLFSAGLAFMISSCLMLLLITVCMFTIIASCAGHHNQSVFDVIDVARPLCYMLQLYFLLLVFFLRLCYVFKGTALRLSNVCVKVYKFIFCTIPFCLILGAFVYTFSHVSILRLLVLIPAFLLVVILIISVVVLFIQKLMQVYKCAGHDEALMGIITKTAILSLLSITMTILSPTCLAISMSVPNVHVQWVANVFVLLDVYTNFVCVALCDRYYSTYYFKICGCLDRRCHVMCREMAGVNDVGNIVNSIQQSSASNGSNSSIGNNQTSAA
eukprot:118574_1